MSFQILGLPRHLFQPLFGLPEHELAARNVRRVVARKSPTSRYPCRVSLRDADDGEAVLLLNYEHLAVDTPYRSRFAIYVREQAVEARLDVGEIPQVMRNRPLAIRAFDATGNLLGAELTQDDTVAPLLQRLLDSAGTDYLHVHNARHGCYVARVERPAPR